MKRRTLVLGGLAAGGALFVGWGVLPPRQRLVPAGALPVAAGQVALNGFVKIAADSSVTAVVPKSEMGQGIHTSVAMLLAEELNADWSKLRIEQAPVDRIYANLATVVDGAPFHPDERGVVRSATEHLTAKLAREVGLMLTGGSSSIKDLWLPVREAGAVARQALVQEAARRWNVPAGECEARDGAVVHAGSGRRFAFGELAAAAAAAPMPAVPALKPPAAWRLIGKPTPRLEAAAKIDGSARYGIDAVLPDMRYASVVLCPVLGGSVERVDAAAAISMPGVSKVVTLVGGRKAAGATGGVAVVADTPWHAIKAARALADTQGAIVWNEGPAATTGSAEVERALAAALARDDGFVYFEKGDTAAAQRGAAKTVSAEYRAPYLAHFALEPLNCTVRAPGNSSDGAEVWASTQVPDIARGVVARTLGVAEEKVKLHVLLLGGGFGRRLDTDFIALAAQVAKAVPGVPVQSLWSREQDTTHDFYRPACAARLEAALGPDGRLLAWLQHSASQSIVPQIAPRWGAGVNGLPEVAVAQDALAEAVWPLFKLPGVAPDKTAAEGAFDQAYEFAAARISHSRVELPVPVGFWRAVGHSHQAFFKESFVDEVAFAARQDPLAFRVALLQNHPRHLAVLNKAAAMAGWGQPAGPASGAKRALGIALHESFGSIVAQVAEVSVEGGSTIRVHRVWCAVDCGTAVNPAGIAQQLEGAVVTGLSAALFGAITLENGRVKQSNFHDQPALRLDASPTVEVAILPSSAHPEGVGEPGLPPIAPAVANAVFALTGQRLRSLPLALQPVAATKP
jgi:isoquinoline 1-oxidoreductase subunit beta